MSAETLGHLARRRLSAKSNYRNPDRKERSVENNFNNAVARETIDIALVAKVIHDSSRRGRSSVARPANAASHAIGLLKASERGRDYPT